MDKEQAIRVLLNSQLLHLWEANGSCSDPSTGAMREVGTALQTIKPHYHIDWACDNCVKNMLNEAVRTKNEHILHFHKFPKQ